METIWGRPLNVSAWQSKVHTQMVCQDCCGRNGGDQLHIKAHDFGIRCLVSMCPHTFGHVVYSEKAREILFIGKRETGLWAWWIFSEYLAVGDGAKRVRSPCFNRGLNSLPSHLLCSLLHLPCSQGQVSAQCATLFLSLWLSSLPVEIYLSAVLYPLSISLILLGLSSSLLSCMFSI